MFSYAHVLSFPQSFQWTIEERNHVNYHLLLFTVQFFCAFLCAHKICLNNCHNSVIYYQVCFAQILNRSQARSNWVWIHGVANIKTTRTKLWKMKCNPVLGRLCSIVTRIALYTTQQCTLDFCLAKVGLFKAQIVFVKWGPWSHSYFTVSCNTNTIHKYFVGL